MVRQFNTLQGLLARQISHEVASYFEESARELRSVARLPSLQREERGPMEADLRAWLRTAERLRARWIGVLDRQGRLQSATASAPTNYVGAELVEWAAKREHRGKVFVSTCAWPAVGRPRSSPGAGVVLSTPLYRSDPISAPGSTARVWSGAVVMALDLEPVLFEHLSALCPQPWSHRVWIMDQDGTILLQSEHPEMTRENVHRVEPQCTQCHLSFDYARQMLTNRNGTAQYQVRGQPKKLAAFAPMHFANAAWIMVVNVPYSEVTAFSHKSFGKMVLLLGIIAVAVCLASVIVHRSNLSRVQAQAETRRWQERVQFEEALRHAEERYRILFEQSADGIVMLDPETTLPIVFNRAAHQRLGYSQEQFARLRLADYQAEDTPEAAPTRLKQLLGHGPASFETRHRTKAGEIRHVEVLAQSLELPGRKVLHCIYHDITERKQAELALERRSAQLEALHQVGLSITAQVDPVILLDTIITQAVALFQGTAGGLFLHRPAQDALELVVRAGNTPAVVGTFLRKGEGPAGRVWETEAPVVVADLHCWEGGAAAFESSSCTSTMAAPLRWGNAFVGVMEICSDARCFFSREDATLLGLFATQAAIAIKNAGLLDQVRRDAAVKTTLLHDVNHRVKNNLMRLVEIVRLEREETPPGEAGLRAVLSDLESRLLGIGVVHSMLAGAQWQPLALDELVTQILTAALSGSPIRKQIQVSVVAPPKPVWVVPEQATALALIINELATNSVKHAFRNRQQGFLSVRLLVEERPGGRPRIKLEYRDDGPGWPEKVLKGERKRVGLHLIQASVRSPLRGELTLRNDGGAAAELSFTLAAAE